CRQKLFAGKVTGYTKDDHASRASNAREAFIFIIAQGVYPVARDSHKQAILSAKLNAFECTSLLAEIVACHQRRGAKLRAGRIRKPGRSTICMLGPAELWLELCPSP